MTTTQTASAACPARSLSQPFSRWSDWNDYFLAPNGGFDSGLASWTTRGPVSVVAENEPWWVGSRQAGNSVRLGGGGSITSAPVCVQNGEQMARFFVKDPGVFGAMLTVTTVITSPRGTFSFPQFSYSFKPGWKAIEQMILPRQSMLVDETVVITIAATGTPANWLIDDVFIDPWRPR